MSIESRSPACLDEEVLASFADGRLKRSEMPAVLEHLRDCPRCMSALEIANELVGTKEARPFRWWWAAAAAAVIAALLVTVPLLRREESPMARLVKLATAGARPVETRLTAFPWAIYRGPMRAEDPAEDARRLQLAGAAGDAVARANADPSAEAQWTAGVALLLAGEPENALKRLRAAGERAPNDAAIWSDLAAALDAAAQRLERQSLHADALAAADRALTLDASHPGALFNRALILEHLGLAGEARKAWDRYLAVDPSSPWANEAREHLKRLAPLAVSTEDARFRGELPRLEQAAVRGDAATVDALVSAYAQQARTWAEAEMLGRWGEGEGEQLVVARAIGEALARRSGETLLRDAVRAIDRAPSADALAQAHVLYRRARIAYGRQQPAAADPELRRAADLFAKADDPMSLVARYFAACTRYDRNDVAGARAELEALRAEVDAQDGYLALAAQIRWQLALTAIVDADWPAALSLASASESLFARLDERANLGFVRGLRATALTSLGRTDEAWDARIASFTILSAAGRADRLPVSIGAAARMELQAGRLDVARALLALELEAARDARADGLLANALVRTALLNARTGDFRAAAAAADEARQTAARISDPRLRDAADADAQLAAAAAVLHAHPSDAQRLLTRAIDFYSTVEKPLFLPQAYLLRARAALRSRDRTSAKRDLDLALGLVERHRIQFAGPVAGTDILDAGLAVGREAIELRLEEGDAAGAFAYAERRHLHFARDAAPIALEVLQRRLAGSGAAVVHFSTLTAEVAAICVTASDVVIARTAFDEVRIASLSARAIGGDDAAAAALHEMLIAPVQPALARATRLIVIPDPQLRRVPFAALYDAKARRHLIEQLPVAIAESASSLDWEPAGSRRQSILAVLLPAAGRDGLPDAVREVSSLQTLYPRFVALTGPRATFQTVVAAAQDVDVVHIAGHTSRPRGSAATAFLFASEETVSWNDVASARFARAPQVVVLAACGTLEDPDPRHARALSLGGGFLAAGAANVIGTLAPVPDRDAQELFQAIHRHLAGGLPAADALRQAQLDAIRTESSTRRTAWRAIALLTRQVA